jgi:photosystem II stability/assembly factor-like uncharacterized protein
MRAAMDRRTHLVVVVLVGTLLFVAGCSSSTVGTASPPISGRGKPAPTVSPAAVPPGINAGPPILIGAHAAVTKVAGSGQLLYSSDSGVSWSPIGTVGSATPSAPPEGWTLESASFVGAQDAWLGFDTGGQMGAPEVARTTDAGQSWSHVTLPVSQVDAVAGLSQVQFTDPDQGWAVVDAYSGQCSFIGYYGSLVRTADGGAHWTVVSALPVACGWAYFSDAQHGWLVRQGAAVDKPWLWYTSDGGSTWQPADLSPPSCVDQGFMPVATAFPAPASLTVSSGTAALLVGCDGYLMSGDSGRSWALLHDPLSGRPSVVRGVGSTTFLMEAMVDSDRTVTVATSRDGGSTWSQLAASGLPADPVLESLELSPSGTAWITVGSAGASWQRLFVSTDGGQHWMNRSPGR